jgi:CubicO group peptidase (beta-lactamase class C family)
MHLPLDGAAILLRALPGRPSPRQRLLTAAAALFALLLGGCTGKTAGTPAPRALLEELDTVVPAALREHRVPGAAVGVVAQGREPMYGLYGRAEARVQITTITKETRFQVASLSKPVAAWTVMALAEAGRLEVDAPVSRYIESWEPPPPSHDWQAVTVRQLLNHTSGLSVGGYHGTAGRDAEASVLEVLHGGTPGDGAVELVQPPGLRERYSGGGYMVLQLLVETVTEEPFSAYADQTVLDPLGMEHATFTPRASAAHAAVGHDSSGTPLPFYHYPEHAAASLVATIQDMTAFARASLPETPNPVLPGDTLRAMQKPSANGSYGLGYRVDRLSDGGTMVSHAGSNRGWRSFLAAFPQAGYAIVILTNGDNGARVITEIMQIVIR